MSTSEPEIGDEVTGNAPRGVRWPITGEVLEYAESDGLRLARIAEVFMGSPTGRAYWVEATTLRRGPM